MFSRIICHPASASIVLICPADMNALVPNLNFSNYSLATLNDISMTYSEKVNRVIEPL